MNLVFLEKDNATLKIKDFTDPTCNFYIFSYPPFIVIHMSWVNGKLFLANDRDFRMVELKTLEPLKNGEERILDVSELKFKIWSTSIPPPLKMHGFFSNSYSES